MRDKRNIYCRIPYGKSYAPAERVSRIFHWRASL